MVNSDESAFEAITLRYSATLVVDLINRFTIDIHDYIVVLRIKLRHVVVIYDRYFLCDWPLGSVVSFYKSFFYHPFGRIKLSPPKLELIKCS